MADKIIHPKHHTGPVGAAKDFHKCNNNPDLNPWQKNQCRAKALGCFAAGAAASGICGGVGMLGGPPVAAGAALACGTLASTACDALVQVPTTKK